MRTFTIYIVAIGITLSGGGNLSILWGQESLVAHYRLDEGMGDIARDSTAVQYHAAIGHAKWVKSDRGTALEFDGQVAFLDCGPITRLGLRELATFSVWIFPKAVPANEAEPTLIGLSPGILGLSYYQGRVYFYLKRDQVYRVAAPAPPGHWYHAVGVTDGKTIKLYLNEVLQASQDVPAGTLLAASGQITIGGQTGQAITFNGLISDARIYRVALSAEQIHGILPSRVGDKMPEGEWKMVRLSTGADDTAEFEETGLVDWRGSKGKVTEVFGTPFRIPESLMSGVRTRLNAKESVAFEISSPAPTVFLLMAVCLPRKEPGRKEVPYAMSQTSCPQRLACELTLEDRSQEMVIPLDLSVGEYQWTHGVRVYAISSAKGKNIKGVTLFDNMATGALGVLAATTSSKEMVNQPKPQFPHYVEQKWKGALNNALTKPEQTQDNSTVYSTDGTMKAECAFLKGRPEWMGLYILPAKGVNLLQKPSSMWDVHVKGQGQAEWSHETTRLFDNGFEIVSVLKPAADRCLRASFCGRWTEPATLTVDFKLENAGASSERIEKLVAPILSNVKFDSLEDTWYWCSTVGGVINNLPVDFKQPYGVWHPLQADGFFSPSLGWGLGFMTRDTEGIFRYFLFKKTEEGGCYGQEYPPCSILPGKAKSTVPVAIRAMPGDWKDQFNWYQDWLKSWWKSAKVSPPWFRQMSSFVHYMPWNWKTAGVSADKTTELAWWAERARKMVGTVDMFYIYGWNCDTIYQDSHDGVYDYELFGGLKAFKQKIDELHQKGSALGLYCNGYLAHVKTEKLYPPLARMRDWQMCDKDGKPMEWDWGNPARMTARMCLSQKEWRDYLIQQVYLRLYRDLKVNLLYVDQFGQNVDDPCYCEKHNHDVPLFGLPYEQVFLKELRATLPDEAAIFTEFYPADVTAQYVNGAYGHVAVYGSEDIGWMLCPHLINLPRFVFPSVKCIDLVSHVLRDGNYDYYKPYLFNGDCMYTAGVLLEQADAEALAWIRNVIRVLKTYEDAFTSDNVEPLVETLIPGVYANRFEGKSRTVWTFYNANHFSVDAKVLSLPAKPNVRYYDAYYERPVKPVMEGDRHLVGALVWPHDIGCLVCEEQK